MGTYQRVLGQYGSRAFSMVQFRPGDIEKITKGLDIYAKQFSSNKLSVQVLRAAAGEVRKAARKIAPLGKRVRPYFRDKRFKIYPGNLRKSIYVFGKTRDGTVQVGPRFSRSVTGDIGKTAASSSGFYAAMIWGNSAAFTRRVMYPALAASEAQAMKKAEAKADQIHARLARTV